MRKTRVAGAAALILSAFPASADPVLECSFDSGSQVETSGCMQRVEERANFALEIALQSARESARELDEITGRTAAEPALDASQKSWLAYRQSQCDYKGAMFGGGSGTGIAIRGCHIRLTRQRTETLLGILP